MRRLKVLISLTDILYIAYFISSWVLTLWVVPNGAMLPDIREGDILVIEERDVITVGDVVVYSIHGDEICRRVTQEIRHGYLTQSDAVGVNDTFILTSDNYKGTVQRVWRNGVAWDKRLRATSTMVSVITVTAFVMLLL